MESVRGSSTSSANGRIPGVNKPKANGHVENPDPPTTESRILTLTRVGIGLLHNSEADPRQRGAVTAGHDFLSIEKFVEL